MLDIRKWFSEVGKSVVGQLWSCKRITYWKMAVFVVCGVGFGFHCHQCATEYLLYSTAMDIKSTSVLLYNAPGVTFANLNKRSRSVVCENPECGCKEYTKEELCKLYPRYCPAGKPTYLKVANLENFRVNESFCLKNPRDVQQTVNEAHVIFDMMPLCVLQTDKAAIDCPYISNVVSLLVKDVKYPFEYNIAFAESSRFFMVTEGGRNFSYRTTMTYHLKTQPEEYLFPNQTVGILVKTSNNMELPNPYHDGYVLRDGRTYYAVISQHSRMFSLKKPYDTDCFDFLKNFKNRGNIGILQQKDCIERCQFESLYSRGKCIDEKIDFYYTTPKCPRGVNVIEDDVIRACQKKCKMPCSSNSVEAKIHEVDETAHFKCDYGSRDPRCKLGTITFHVVLAPLLINMRDYRARTDLWDMIGFLGGYLSLWIILGFILANILPQTARLGKQFLKLPRNDENKKKKEDGNQVKMKKRRKRSKDRIKPNSWMGS